MKKDNLPEAQKGFDQSEFQERLSQIFAPELLRIKDNEAQDDILGWGVPSCPLRPFCLENPVYVQTVVEYVSRFPHEIKEIMIAWLRFLERNEFGLHDRDTHFRFHCLVIEALVRGNISSRASVEGSSLGSRPAPGLAFQHSSPEGQASVLAALDSIKMQLEGVQNRGVFEDWLRRKMAVHPQRLEHKVPFAIAAHSPCQHGPLYGAAGDTVQMGGWNKSEGPRLRRSANLPNFDIAFIDGAFRHVACGAAVSPVVRGFHFPDGE